MNERLDEITDCLTEAEAWLFDTLGADGKEEARAWIWAALTELEALRRLVTYDDDEIRLWIGSNVEQRQSARWPAEVAAVRLKAREERTMVGSTKLTAEELVQSARPWYWHTSTCTHGGYGRCKEGCKKEGFWGYVPKLGKETWLGELLWKADIPVVLGAVNSHDAGEELLLRSKAIFRVVATMTMPLQTVHAFREAIVKYEKARNAP